ncbi:hypothetical protein [Actinomadura sp. GTD37]|uniref:hypothetical protein n=1 Tax=Actinomadura sp. GTD37 TaxID=1778030 RepID=UPI0035C1A998
MVSSDHRESEGSEVHLSIEDKLADTVRELIATTGLTSRGLEKETQTSEEMRSISRTSWSAYQCRNNPRIIPLDALEWIIQFASSAPRALKKDALHLHGQTRPQLAPPASQANLPGEPGAAHAHGISSTGPVRRRRYRVHRDGNIVDSTKKPIGAIVAGDIFRRDDSTGHPTLPYRYYGTVTSDDHAKMEMVGYVLQEKLTYLDTIYFCSGDGDDLIN